jgi:hypothetical protein
MNEKTPQADYYGYTPRKTFEQYYQDAVTVLLYNSLALANPNNSILQPTVKEGRQTIELIPRDTCWDNLCIVIHHEGESIEMSNRGELQASISLGQIMNDRSGQLEPTGLEFIEEYEIYFHNGEYKTYRYNKLNDYGNPDPKEATFVYDNERLATDWEVAGLNKIINSARIRPLDF